MYEILRLFIATISNNKYSSLYLCYSKSKKINPIYFVIQRLFQLIIQFTTIHTIYININPSCTRQVKNDQRLNLVDQWFVLYGGR